MRRIFTIKLDLVAGEKKVDSIDIDKIIGNVNPIVRKIWQDNVEPGIATLLLKHVAKEIEVVPTVDVAAYHRENKEKAIIDIEGGKFNYTVENLSANPVKFNIYFEAEYPGII